MSTGDRPRLGLEQQREADDAEPAPAPRRRSGAGAPACARPRPPAPDRRRRARRGRAVVALEEGQQTHAGPMRGVASGRRHGRSPWQRYAVCVAAKRGRPCLQHAAHGEERSEDHDSISGVCRGRRPRCRACIGAGVRRWPARRARVLCACQRASRSPRRRGARRRQVGEVPAVDQRRRCARSIGARSLSRHRAEHRVGAREEAHLRRGSAPAPRPHAGCAPRRAPASAGRARSGSGPAARPSPGRCAPPARVTGRRSRSASSAASTPDGIEQLVGAAQRRIGQAAVAPAAAGPGPLLRVAASS